MKKSARGFTLVELLVVITILAILMTIGIAVYSGVQKNARDIRRKSDLRTIKIALELYYQSNGQYPISAAPYKFSTGPQPWITELNANYVSSGELPKDPINGGSNPPWALASDGYKYGYATWVCTQPPGYPLGQFYVLAAQLENKNDGDNIHNKGTKDCTGATLESEGWSPSVYAITSI